MKNNILNSPIKWVGGKSRLRKYIIPLIPDHSCYVEPFAGGAWVLFGKSPSSVEVINDIDAELINFFDVIKRRPKAFLKSFSWTIVSRYQFNALAHTDPLKMSSIARAHRFYYLIMAGWGGELKYPRFQTSISDGGHGNRLIGALKHLEEKILPVHQRLQTVIIENLDWRDCIERYDSPHTFMYLDPPYPGNGVNYAHNMRDWKHHYELVERLRAIKGKWMMSSYDQPEVRALFSDFQMMEIRSSSGMSTDKNQSGRVVNRELLIANYPLVPLIETDKILEILAPRLL